MTTKRISWERLFLEGVVIVVSILLAFALQAWWEGRQESEQRQAILSGLASDFAAASEDLMRSAARHERVLAAAERILKLISERDTGPELQSTVDSLLSDLVGGGTWDPPMGTLDALVSSGQLEVLRNVELVNALTRWPAVVGDLTEDEDQGVENYRSRLLPYLESRVRVSDLVWSDLRPSRRLPWEHNHTNAYQLLIDLEFANIVYDRWDIYTTVVKFATPRTEQALEHIRELIDAELEAR